MVTCVLLSAGESQRFGSPKALAKTSQKTAIEDLQDTLIASIADDIIVVLGAYAEAIGPHVFNHKKVRIVHNKDYKLGQTSSFQAGLRALKDNASAVLLTPVDCPFIRTSTVDVRMKGQSTGARRTARALSLTADNPAWNDEVWPSL